MEKSPQFKKVPKKKETVTLYHGTTRTESEEIDKHGIRMNKAQQRIGSAWGIYATTDPERAEKYANRRAEARGDTPHVVEFEADSRKVQEAARPGEVVHWGNVSVKRIKSIWEADPDKRFED